jgi:hypothetical protein
MKRAEKEKALRQIQALNAGLHPNQLSVIRKLISPSSQLISSYSRRTVEAILQGRRKDGQTLYDAITIARKELARCNTVMEEIEKILTIK